MALADIAGLGAYYERRRQNEAAPLAELQQVAGVQGLLAKMQAQRQDEQTRAALAASGGDVNKAIEALIKGGNVEGAQKLATVAEVQRKAKPQNRIVPPGGVVLGEDNKPLFTAPFKPDAPAKPEARPEILRLQEAASKLPPGSPIRAQIEARIKVLGERSAGVNVYSGSLTAGVDAEGNPVFVQASPRPGTPPRTVEGVYPPERPAAAKAVRERQEAEVTAQNVRERIKRMSALIQGGGMAGGVVGPLGTASRIGETAVGAVKQDTPTPAIDFENEQALLLADVRKLVEKDPNLSKDERERLYQTLGGGFWQTPGSALRALNNVVEYVESKKMTGPSRGAQLETAVRGAGWDYEPGKYDYRIVNGQVQRKAKGK